MNDATFRKYVAEGIDALPAWVREELINVSFIVLDNPTEEQCRENDVMEGELLFGLYEGTPLPERGNEAMLFPDTIFIFKQAILKAYTREEEVKACVHNTIWHEVAHFFGHGEAWIREEEIRRNKML